jgi:hypothetical protein
MMTFTEAIAACPAGHKITYGTRSNQWHIIDQSDHDFYTPFAILPERAAAMGEAATLATVTGAWVL